MLQLVRRYKMSDSSLMTVCMRLEMGVSRDATTMASYGWSPARITALGDAREAFTDLPTDAELSGMMAAATAAKNLARKNATDFSATEIMVRVSVHFGEGSPEYRRFKASELYSSTDGECYFALKRIHRQGTLLLAALADEGLTSGILDGLRDRYLALEASLEAQNSAIDNRDAAVQARIVAGNALYDEMVKLGEVGKRVWLNVDESKYNDYVLYPHRGGVEPEDAEQVFESEIASQTVLNLSVTNLDGAETFRADNVGDSALKVYFAALPTDLPPDGAAIFYPGEAMENSIAAVGYEPSVREYLNIYNPSEDQVGNIALTVTG